MHATQEFRIAGLRSVRNAVPFDLVEDVVVDEVAADRRFRFVDLSRCSYSFGEGRCVISGVTSLYERGMSFPKLFGRNGLLPKGRAISLLGRPAKRRR